MIIILELPFPRLTVQSNQQAGLIRKICSNKHRNLNLALVNPALAAPKLIASRQVVLRPCLGTW